MTTITPIETNSYVMETEESVNRNNNKSQSVYGATNECTPFIINNQFNANVIQNNSLTNTLTTSHLIDISNDKVSQSQIHLSDGSIGTHSRLGLPLCDKYKPSDDVISNIDSIYTVRSDSQKTDRTYDAKNSCWWSHPQVKSHWRVFMAAFGLLTVGIGLIAMGIVVIVFPEIGFQSYVFFIAGIICFIPGAYHVVYVYCAVKGRRGYDFHELPLFN